MRRRWHGDADLPPRDADLPPRDRNLPPRDADLPPQVEALEAEAALALVQVWRCCCGAAVVALLLWRCVARCEKGARSRPRVTFRPRVTQIERKFEAEAEAARATAAGRAEQIERLRAELRQLDRQEEAASAAAAAAPHGALVAVQDPVGALRRRGGSERLEWLTGRLAFVIDECVTQSVRAEMSISRLEIATSRPEIRDARPRIRICRCAARSSNGHTPPSTSTGWQRPARRAARRRRCAHCVPRRSNCYSGQISKHTSSARCQPELDYSKTEP